MNDNKEMQMKFDDWTENLEDNSAVRPETTMYASIDKQIYNLVDRLVYHQIFFYHIKGLAKECRFIIPFDDSGLKTCLKRIAELDKKFKHPVKEDFMNQSVYAKRFYEECWDNAVLSDSIAGDQKISINKFIKQEAIRILESLQNSPLVFDEKDTGDGMEIEIK